MVAAIRQVAENICISVQVVEKEWTQKPLQPRQSRHHRLSTIMQERDYPSHFLIFCSCIVAHAVMLTRDSRIYMSKK